MAQLDKPLDPNGIVRIEVSGSSASQVRENLLNLIGAAPGVDPFVINTAGSFNIQKAEITAASINTENVKPEEKDAQENDAHAYAAECEELASKLDNERAKVATLEKTVTKLNTQLKDAEAGGEKSHKAFLEEQKRADAAEARIKDLETQLKAANAKPADSAPADNATNDDEADAALNTPDATVNPADATDPKAADDGKAKPGARTNRTTRNVSKPAEETADQKALRETITNDLLDLGGLAEKNAQVATDVEEVLAKYNVTNGADFTTEQLADAAADIAELIGVYFRE